MRNLGRQENICILQRFTIPSLKKRMLLIFYKGVHGTDLYINNLDTGLASLSIANGDHFKLTDLYI